MTGTMRQILLRWQPPRGHVHVLILPSGPLPRNHYRCHSSKCQRISRCRQLGQAAGPSPQHRAIARVSLEAAPAQGAALVRTHLGAAALLELLIHR